jgi:septal ring factor EnvC (AmiA/AmiB activator)
MENIADKLESVKEEFAVTQEQLKKVQEQRAELDRQIQAGNQTLIRLQGKFEALQELMPTVKME